MTMWFTTQCSGVVLVLDVFRRVLYFFVMPVYLPEPAQPHARVNFPNTSEKPHYEDFYSFPTPFLPPLFNSKSKELLTGSVEVLLIYASGAFVLIVGEQGIRSRAERPKKMWPQHCLKFHLGPFTSVDPYTFIGHLPAWCPFASFTPV